MPPQAPTEHHNHHEGDAQHPHMPPQPPVVPPVPPQPQTVYTPQPVPKQFGADLLKKINLNRTSNAFVAEYSIMLIALTMALSNLIWLVFVFAGLMEASMGGGLGTSSLLSTPMLVLWIAVLSLVVLPVMAVFWSRSQGEMQANAEFSGGLPKGGARGFRTFWLVVSGLGIMLMTATALYVPLVAAISGDNALTALLTGTLPSLAGAVIIGVGMFMVTRDGAQRGLIKKLLWGMVLLSFLLVAVDYAWASGMKASTTNPFTPSSPTVPPPSYDFDSNDYYNSYPY